MAALRSASISVSSSLWSTRKNVLRSAVLTMLD